MEKLNLVDSFNKVLTLSFDFQSQINHACKFKGINFVNYVKGLEHFLWISAI